MIHLRILTITIMALWLGYLPASAQDTYYEIDNLNIGLEPAPDRVDRRSPQATMESLFDLVEQGDPAAAHTLNLNDLDRAQQADQGSELARMLVTLFNRKVILDWNRLLERPDSLNANETSESAVAGQSRRSLLLGTLDGPKRPVALRLDRFKVKGQEPVWLISPESVANIPALYRLYGPSEFEKSLPAPLRAEAFWRLLWWEVIALPLVFLAAFGMGLGVYKLLSAAANSKIGTFAGRALRSARIPAVIASVALVVAVARQVFVFSGIIDTIIGPTVTLGFVVAAMMLLTSVADELLDYISPREGTDITAKGREESRSLATNLSVARRVLILIVFLVGAGIVLSQANLFATFGFSLLASAGVITLVLGVAARDILGNILSSLQIALNHSARIGDKVLFDGQVCTVERINFTYIQLRVWTGVRLIVPVREFVSDQFENWSVQEPQMVRLVELRLAHGAPVDRMRQAFESVLDEIDPQELDDRSKSQTLVTGHDVFGQIVTFCVACANPNTAWEISCQVREGLLLRARELEQAGEVMFPEANPAQAA